MCPMVKKASDEAFNKLIYVKNRILFIIYMIFFYYLCNPLESDKLWNYTKMERFRTGKMFKQLGTIQIIQNSPYPRIIPLSAEAHAQLAFRLLYSFNQTYTHAK